MLFEGECMVLVYVALASLHVDCNIEQRMELDESVVVRGDARVIMLPSHVWKV